MTMSYGYAYKPNNGRPSQYSHHENFYDTPLPVSTSTAISYALLLIGAVLYLMQRSEMIFIPSIPEILWNTLVSLTPSSLVLALDKQGTAALVAGEEDQGIYAVSRTFGAKSEAMRRVLGLDGSGLLTSFQRTRSLPNLRTVFKAPSSNALPGLGNWDNSCYQNSVIQGLASLPPLMKFLDETYSLETEKNPTSTKNALMDIIGQLNDSNNFGRRLWTPPALKSMSSWQQQDAQEYYSKVIEELEKEVSRSLKSKTYHSGLVNVEGLDSSLRLKESTQQPSLREEEPSLKRDILTQSPIEITGSCLRNPLEGLLAQRVGCLNCGLVEGLSLIPFNCLTIPLGRQGDYVVEDCLDEYTTLEPISGVECANCTLQHQKGQLERILSLRSLGSETGDVTDVSAENLYASAQSRLDAVNTALSASDFSESTLSKKCMISSKSRVTTTKSRQAVIARAPRSLVLHVNRSMFDEYSGIQSKNYADVRFPRILDLSPWCLGSSCELGKEIVEKWETNPAKSMLIGDGNNLATADGSTDVQSRSRLHKTLYNLRAVVTHYGRHENGHYITYRQDPQATQLGDMKDDAWWRLSDDEVCRVYEDDVLAQGGVFMLFYEQIEDLNSMVEHEKKNIPVSGPTMNEEEALPKSEATALESFAVEQKPPDLEPEDLKIPESPNAQSADNKTLKDRPSSPNASLVTKPNFIPSRTFSLAQAFPENIDMGSKSEVSKETLPPKERHRLAPRMRTAGDLAGQIDCVDAGGNRGMIQAN